MNPALRQSAAHVFVESLAAPVLSDDDAHHVLRVLRVRASDAISLSDGCGQWTTGTIASDGAVTVTAPVATEVQGRVLTIGVAIPKGDRPEWIAQKLTELGVRTIAFMQCERNVVRWEGERGVRQLERVRRVTREAAMQSRSVWLPSVPEVQAFADLVTSGGVVLADPEGEPLPSDARAVLVGPEGGFTAHELSLGDTVAKLSHQVLRVETAAIVAATLLLAPPRHG